MLEFVILKIMNFFSTLEAHCTKIFLGIIVLNSIASWVLFGVEMRKVQHLNTLVHSSSSSVAPTSFPQGATPSSTLLPPSDLAQVTARLSALEQKIASLPSPSPQKTTTIYTTAQTAKEYIIYLGTGNTSNREWTEQSGAVADINLDNYPHIKSVTFEAALSILGGDAHARLLNKTTGAVYYNTDVTHNTGTAMWKTSSPIQLPSGKSSYIVQLRSTSGEMANLIGSRLRIVLR